ncbi:MAG TPA: J domain-containing protein [Stellaceae bacterium]|nr:J domain-containing protein [Stellaceae bacterium]
MAADDPYAILGVKRTATEAEIRRAYRKLAKEFHPDLNPGKKEAEARFKAINAAYGLLSDPEKRARFDRGEIDASGAERPERSFYRRHAEGPQGRKYHPGGSPFEEADLGSIFADFFAQARQGGAGTQGRAGFRMRGADRSFALEIDFLEAARGAKKRISLAAGEMLDVTIPAGFKDGQVLRLNGKGEPGLGGGPAGDALVAVHVRPHPFFRREGDDIHVEVPVTLAEAVLGGKITVPTIGGPVALTIPKASDSGTVLRLRGRGIAAPGRAAGDQYVTLKLVIGAPADPELAAFLRDWAPRHPQDPRRKMVES